MGDFSQACPGARVNGNCVLERLVFLGSNVTLMPGVKVGYRATIGANSQVVRSLEPLVTLAGVPARIICRPAANESPA